MELPSFLTTEMDNNLFFSTLATTSTVFILVMTTLAIHRVSTIDSDKRNKRHEVDGLELEIAKLRSDNERKQAIINRIVTSGNTITKKQEERYRECAKLIMRNNTIIADKEQLIKENDDFLKHHENIDVYLNKSIHYLYIFSCLYIVIPLVVLSLPNSILTVVSSNSIKLVLIATMILFILKIIKDCKENLLSSNFLDNRKKNNPLLSLETH